MADLTAVIPDQLAVGQPIPFNVFDFHHRLLLQRGYIISSQAQLERLLDRGIFYEKEILELSKAPAGTEAVSAYLGIRALRYDFESIFDREIPDYSVAIPNIAERIQKLCELDSAAAIASIQHQMIGKYSLRHAFNTAVMTEILLKRLGRSPTLRSDAASGALTMNIGMLELQDILYNQKTSLTIEQKHAILAHSEKGARILRERNVLNPNWLKVVEHHHEMIDGTGYPKRLRKEDLSIESQTVSLADRYCSMISERAYRPARLPTDAAKDLLKLQSATIAPELADAFLKEVGIYPPGTAVLLSNGEMAVVIRRLLTPNQPLVRSLQMPNGIRYSNPPKRLTSKSSYAIKEVLCTDIIRYFDLAMLWPPRRLGDTIDIDECAA